ncbi:MAG: histidine--tRNA ligase [Proteobacteria bacterium]|nr:histidine--tRNA ligase [Pseudomonadota bacterium]
MAKDVNNKRIKARKLKGFRDYFDSEINLRFHVVEQLKQVGELFGFQPTDTPALEYAEVLLGEGGETDKQAYTFTDQGGREVALRYDLTMPFARFVCEHQGRYHLPLKRMQIGKVWRAEKPQKGRYREFLQGDVDILGESSIYAELDILLLMASFLARFPSLSFVIHIGHREVLSYLVQEVLGLKDSEQERTAFIIIDKLSKVGRDVVSIKLAEIPGIQQAKIPYFLDLITVPLETTNNHNSSSSPCFDYLKNSDVWPAMLSIQNMVSQVNAQYKNVVCAVDLSLARGLDYYTGIVFETMITGHEDLGSIWSGGRYARIMNRFQRTSHSGVGASLGIDRFVSVLLGTLPATDPVLSATSPFVFLVTDLKQPHSLEAVFVTAQKLRALGITVCHGLSQDKVRKQYQQAARLQAKYAVFLEFDQSTLGPQFASQCQFEQIPVKIKELALREENSGYLSDLVQKFHYLRQSPTQKKS